MLFGLLTLPIQEDLKLDDVQIGLINTSLFCTLAIMTPIAGFLGDRISRKWIITISLLFWSLMTACTGLVGGMCGLIFFRSIATGGGESFYAPSAYALLASHHKETRSIAMSVHQAALYIGLMFSGVLVAWALRALGSWRLVFFVFGAAGFLLGILFIFKLKEAAAEVTKNVAAPSVKIPLIESIKAYFANPSALLATCGFIAVVVANNAYLSWGPKFAARKFSLSVGAAGNGTMLYHHLAAFAAILLGGVITDKFVAKFPRFRLLLQGTALMLGAPCLVWFGFAPSAVSMWCAVASYGIFRGLFEVNTHASLFDVIEPKYRSTATGLLNMLAFFLGSLSPLAIGYLSKTHGIRGFEFGFAAMGGIYIIGALMMFASAAFTFNKNKINLS